MQSSLRLLLLSAVCAAPSLAQLPSAAKPVDDHLFYETEDGLLVGADAAGTRVWNTFQEYIGSEFFRRYGKRCAAPARDRSPVVVEAQTDCNSVNTSNLGSYDPQGGGLYTIPVVVHVLAHPNGTGDLSNARIQSQIDVLNADFGQLSGARIEFVLAGVTRSFNRQWFNDRQSYWNQLAWDPTRYLNIYTNTAGGNLGYAYVPSGGGVVGNTWDRVVIYYRAFGDNSGYAPYDLGRTATHEVGHYLGLYHTFDDGCHGGNCNQQGDLVCDTAPEASPNFSVCPPSTRDTCGSLGLDPIENFMDYSEDACMNEFSADQVGRMRCTIENFRADLISAGPTLPGAATDPSPADGASGVPTNAQLSWTTGSGATMSEVFFGTPGNLTSLGMAGTTIDPGLLAAGAMYGWRVDSTNAAGTTTGTVWSFTTATSPGGGDLFYDGFESGGLSADWGTSGNVSVSGAGANVGSFGAQLRRTAWMEFSVTVPITGSYALSFDLDTQAYDPADGVEVFIGGTSVYTGSPSSWASVGPIPLVPGPTTIRFAATADRNNERAYLDEVRVSGG